MNEGKPFVRVKDLTNLDPCIIEELYIDEKFLSYPHRN